MKAFFVVCFAVAALAESDPNLVLTTGIHTGLPLTTSYFGSPLVSAISPVQYIAQPTMKIAKEMEEKPEVLVKKVEEETEQVVPTTQYINQVQYLNPFQALARTTYVAKNGEVEHKVVLNKREAEADPLTIYPGFYNRYATVSGFVPSIYSNWYTNKATFINPFTGDVTGKVTNDAVTAKNYARKGAYVARAPGTNTVHIAKREAEADPLTVISNPLMYNTHPSVYSPVVSSAINPVVYNSAIKPVVYNSAIKPVVYNSAIKPVVYNSAIKPVVYNTAIKPVVYSSPLVKSVVSVPNGVEGVVDGKTVADDAMQWTPAYSRKGSYIAQTPGSKHVAKREADPLLVRSNYFNYPLTTTYAGNYYNPTVVRSSLYNYSPLRTVGSPVIYY